MNYLSVENLSKSFDEKVLFEKLTFGLEQGQKAALVGINGCGKSTLLRIIAGKETPNTGLISFRKGLRVSMLTQNPVFEDNATILQAVFSENIAELNAIRDYEMALLQMEMHPERETDISPFIEQIDSLNAWEYEHQVKQVLGKLGIHDLEQKLGTLSGGQRKRVAIAQALVVKPDVLILDEPTNHLDLEIIEWLENYLATQNMTLLMVTHDRYFLDRVTNEILELENGEMYRYKGNYSAFLEMKAEREQQEAASVEKAQNLMRKELDWMRRQPKARGTKAKYRVEAFYDLKDKASKKTEAAEMEVNLKGERQGKKILEVHHMRKSYGDRTIVADFSYVFRQKERVGIIGSNGAGKSTFLNLITGKLASDNGKIDPGQTTKFGYYTQEEALFKPEMKVLDVVKEIAEVIKLADGSEVTASQLLNQFLFPPKAQYNTVGKLSGGEKRRLQLLRVLMGNPNFLILDEPTNDFDITTLNVLEDYLDRFEGCLMVVSHDRYFMDRLVDHLFIFEGDGKIRDFPGNYTDYREKEGSPVPMTPTKKSEFISADNPIEKPKPNADKLSYKEKQAFEELEKTMASLEKKVAELSEKILHEKQYEKLMDLGNQIEKLKTELEEKELMWLEFSERL